MTTIAYKDGVLAADGNTTLGWTRISTTTQKIRLLPGYAVGCSGNAHQGQAFVEWLGKHLRTHGQLVATPKELKIDDEKFEMTALVVSKTGQLWIYSGLSEPLPLDNVFHAIGSGADIALGAMTFGATAEQAVKVAIEKDIGSSGQIQVVKLEDIAPAGRKKATKPSANPIKTAKKIKTKKA